MPSSSSPPRSDAALNLLLRALATAAAAVMLLVLVFLVVESWPALRDPGAARFFEDSAWNPTAGGGAAQFGMLPMVAGTVLASLGALLLAVPLALACALFGRLYAPRWLARQHRRLLELMAGVPSVVYGFWGLVVLVPLLARVEPPGHSLAAGSIVLALMILPTIALLADGALAGLPERLHHVGAALGLSRWALARSVLLPAARAGLASAVVLGAARALGETMVVLMVCGNVVQMPGSVFDPVRTLTANIALEMPYATESHRAVLFVSGLALLGVVGLLVVVTELLSPGDET